MSVPAIVESIVNEADKGGRPPLLVVKIGSSSLVDAATWRLDKAFVHNIAQQVGSLVTDHGWRVIIVTSGAVACGVSTLSLNERPPGIPQKQALASLGQVTLAAQWQSALLDYGLHAAQLLLTHGDFADRERSQNLMATLRVLLDWGAVPVVNENDPIATAELAVGDNDQLSALMALQIGATALLLLTDIDGVYDKNPMTDPTALRIPELTVVNAEHLAAAGGPGSSKGRGGMRSKLESARLASAGGVNARIAAARAPNVLLRSVLSDAALSRMGVEGGTDIGTRVPAAHTHFTQRRRWLSGQRCAGRVFVDDGAVRALQAKKSLLFVGVVAVEGEFAVGDTVSIVEQSTKAEVARGLAGVDHTAMGLARGLRTDPARLVLQNNDLEAAIHRDDILLLSRETVDSPRLAPQRS